SSDLAATPAARIVAPGDTTTLELIKAPPALYPEEAVREGIQGQVWMRVLISATGKVEKVQLLSGNPLLAEAAVSTAKKYRFKPYIKNGKPTELWTKIPLDFYFSDKIVDLSKNTFSGQVTPSTAGSAASPAVSDVTAPSAPIGDSASAGTAASSASAPSRVTVTEQESESRLTHQIAPFYPHPARRNHVEGTVSLKAVIGKDGRIASLTPISGPPDLIPATIGAVEQWRYRPYLQGGKPAEMETVITVNFSLKH
ncbi:MAG: energy transducer TonB, partial [Terriglobales bacterium]